MMYVNTIVYYTLISSAVLFYGIGLNKVAEFGTSKKETLTFFLKMIASIFVTSSLSWVLIITILTPLNLIELYPLLALLVFMCVNAFLEAIVRLTTGKEATEFIVSFLIVILSLSESTSLLNTIIICISCFCSFLLLWPFVYTFQHRLTTNGHKINIQYYSLFFIFLAILIVIVSVFDVSWLNKGVIQ